MKTYPEHFFDDTPTHTLPPHKWYEYSHNPTPDMLDRPPRAWAPDTLRARAHKIAQLPHVQFEPWRFVEAFTHYISSLHGGKITFTQQEAEFWLRLLFTTEPCHDEDTLDAVITDCIDAIAQDHRLTLEQVHASLVDWLALHGEHLDLIRSTMSGVAFLLRERFDTCTAIETMLELTPEQALVKGLKFLASYHLDDVQTQRIHRAVDVYMSTHREIRADVEVELVRLSPTRSRVESILERAHDKSYPAHQCIKEDHRVRAIFAIQDPDLFREIHYEQGAAKAHFTPSLFIAHVHHFGLNHLNMVTPFLIDQINTWSMMQWGVVFKVCAEELTDVMLTALLEEHRYEDFKRLANAWLFEGGKKIVTRCIALAHQSDALRDIALDTLETYAKLGHHALIFDELARLHHTRDDPHIAQIMARCARSSEHITPTSGTLPIEHLPDWLAKWCARGLQPNTPLHLDPARFPRLYLQNAPPQPLDETAIRAILRYLQQHAEKHPRAPMKIAALLDNASRDRLCDHLLTIWNVQSQRSEHAWLALSCAAMMHDAQIDALLDEVQEPRSFLHLPKNWHQDMLIVSQNTRAMEALIESKSSWTYDTSRSRYSTPSVIRKLARIRGICDIALLARHETRHDIIAGGYIHLTHAGSRVEVSYDDRFEPVITSTPTLSEFDLSVVRTHHLEHMEKRLLAIYQEILPRVIRDVEPRHWTYQTWRSAMDHPLIMQLHRAILWHIVMKDGSRKRARCLEDITLHDQFDAPIPGHELLGATFYVALPEKLGISERTRWGILLAEDEQHLLCQEI